MVFTVASVSSLVSSSVAFST